MTCDGYFIDKRKVKQMEKKELDKINKLVEDTEKEISLNCGNRFKITLLLHSFVIKLRQIYDG